MGHAGAVISGGDDTAESKIAALKAAGIAVADGPHLLGVTMQQVLTRKIRSRPVAVPAPAARGGPAKGTAARAAGKKAKPAAKPAAKRVRAR
jgi:ribosomal protein L12E/L44/L45/RPP1/RPP2